MRTVLLILLLSSPFVCVAQDVVIENVSIISAHQEVMPQPMDVLIQNGRITQIGKVNVNSSSSAERVDGTGKFLLPGIMDSHAHVSSIPGMGFGVEPVARAHPDLAHAYYAQQANSFLYHGVTQVLDPNPGLNWSQFTASKHHPDYFRCEVITSKNTFPVVEKNDAKSKQMFQYLVQENVDVNHPESPEQVVERIRLSGASCIKLYFEDGYGQDSYWPLLSETTLKRIRSAADQHHLAILAHANALDMYQHAIGAQVDVIAHGMWNWGEYSRDKTLPDAIKKVLDKVMEKHIGYMPTQRVIAGLGELMLAETVSNPAFENVTPRQLLDWYKSPEADHFKQELKIGFDNLPDQVIANIFINGRVTKGAQVMDYFSAADYPVLLGSDFPGSPTYANQPGLTTFQEMKMMVEAGLSLKQVLFAATINNAKQFGLEQDFGTVEVGKVANLLLLNSNPMVSVDAWNDISLVLLHGKLLSRQTLAANSK